MNKIELQMWKLFKEKHKKANEVYIKYQEGGGIGIKLTAIAEYKFIGVVYSKVKEDITDYESW